MSELKILRRLVPRLNQNSRVMSRDTVIAAQMAKSKKSKKAKKKQVEAEEEVNEEVENSGKEAKKK